jgi:hypothetical protein
LFFSLSTRAYGEKMNPSSLTLLFRTIQKKAELTKKLAPHIFRHTAASNDGYHYTAQELELKYGWAKGSDMAKIYCHLSEIRMNEHLKRKAGLTPELVEKDSKCPICGAINNINAIHCHNCKNIISRDELIKRAKSQQEREQKINEAITGLQRDNKDYRKMFNTMKDVIQKYEDGKESMEKAFDKAKKDIPELIEIAKDKEKLKKEWEKLKPSHDLYMKCEEERRDKFIEQMAQYIQSKKN